jgi:hypothetical protein
MSSFCNINQYRYVIRRISSVVAYCSIRMGSRDRILVKFFYAAIVVILHYTKNYYTKVLYFPKIYNHTSLYGPVACGARVDPTSQVCPTAMLVLLIVGNSKVRF